MFADPVNFSIPSEDLEYPQTKKNNWELTPMERKPNSLVLSSQ